MFEARADATFLRNSGLFFRMDSEGCTLGHASSRWLQVFSVLNPSQGDERNYGLAVGCGSDEGGDGGSVASGEASGAGRVSAAAAVVLAFRSGTVAWSW